MNAVGTVRGGRVLGHHLLGDPSLVLHGPERIVRGRRWGLWVDRPPVSGDTWCPPMPVRFSNGWRSPARYGLSLVKARPANDGRGAAASATGLSGTAQGAERRVFDRRLGIVGQCQLDKAVKILQHLGIPLDRGLPVLVDSTLQLSLSRSDLVRMRRRMVVMIRMCCDTLQVVAMRCFPSLGKESEVLQDVVLRMCPYPCSVGRERGRRLARGQSTAVPRRWRGRGKYVPYVIVYRLHHTRLGLADCHVEALGLAVTRERGRGVAYGTVRVHPDDGLARLGVVVVAGIHLSRGRRRRRRRKRRTGKTKETETRPAGRMTGETDLMIQGGRKGALMSTTIMLRPHDPRRWGPAREGEFEDVDDG